MQIISKIRRILKIETREDIAKLNEKAQEIYAHPFADLCDDRKDVIRQLVKYGYDYNPFTDEVLPKRKE